MNPYYPVCEVSRFRPFLSLSLCSSLPLSSVSASHRPISLCHCLMSFCLFKKNSVHRLFQRTPAAPRPPPPPRRRTFFVKVLNVYELLFCAFSLFCIRFGLLSYASCAFWAVPIAELVRICTFLSAGNVLCVCAPVIVIMLHVWLAIIDGMSLFECRIRSAERRLPNDIESLKRNFYSVWLSMLRFPFFV